ncbi:MAG: aminotransferase class IV [Vampirovibrio sp.]|nr:aminotransferase class IV [Vampirovibrio sp.]
MTSDSLILKDNAWVASSTPTSQASPEMLTTLLYGYSVYTTFATPLPSRWLQAHLQRLAQNAQTLDIQFHWEHQDLAHSLSPFLKQPQVVRLTVLPFINTFNTLVNNNKLPADLMVSTRPLPFLSGEPLSLALAQHQRILPTIKHGSMVAEIQLRKQAQQAGLDDVLFHNAQRHLTEASTANFFGLRQSTLYTSDPYRDGCLPGITRQHLVDWAAASGIPVNTTPLPLDALKTLDGAFLTNAVTPIRRVRHIKAQEANLQCELPWPNDAIDLCKSIETFFRQTSAS